MIVLLGEPVGVSSLSAVVRQVVDHVLQLLELAFQGTGSFDLGVLVVHGSLGVIGQNIPFVTILANDYTRRGRIVEISDALSAPPSSDLPSEAFVVVGNDSQLADEESLRRVSCLEKTKRRADDVMKPEFDRFALETGDRARRNSLNWTDYPVGRHRGWT